MDSDPDAAHVAQRLLPEIGGNGKGAFNKPIPLTRPTVLSGHQDASSQRNDWAESFVGLNLALKPLVDELFMKYLSDVALREDDCLLGQIFYSLNEDCQWHRQWSECLVRMAIEDNVRNRDTIQGWIDQWYQLAAPGGQ